MPKRPDVPYMTLSEAKSVYKSITRKLPFKSYIAGSVRREQERVNDLDILIITKNAENDYIKSVMESIFTKIERFGSKIINGICMYNGHKVLVDFFIIKKEELPYAMLQYTGPKTYNIRLRKYVKDQGMLLNQYGLFYANKPDIRVRGTASIKTEKELIKFIGTTYYQPWERH